MPDDPVESAERLLIVEGVNDRHVVRQILSRIGGGRSIEIVDTGGIEPLLDSIEARMNYAGRVALGVVADANDDINARWQSIRSRMPDRIDLPDRPPAGGVIAENQPRVGVWLMPDNDSPGELEDFVQRMIPTDDAVWPLAERYIDAIPAPDRKFPPGKISRAKLYARLAARQDPRRMGEAIRTRDLATDGALCQQFATWLRRLFG